MPKRNYEEFLNNNFKHTLRLTATPISMVRSHRPGFDLLTTLSSCSMLNNISFMSDRLLERAIGILASIEGELKDFVKNFLPFDPLSV